MFSFTLAAAVSAVVLDWCVCAGVRRTAISSSLGFIGTVSYSIYLWHQPLLAGFSSRLLHYMNEPLLIVSFAIFIVALSFLSFRILERGGVVAGTLLLNFAQRRAAERTAA
jgi:peptidoglycan/LPS O-acetylase OafA/YrhL